MGLDCGLGKGKDGEFKQHLNVKSTEQNSIGMEPIWREVGETEVST